MFRTSCSCEQHGSRNHQTIISGQGRTAATCHKTACQQPGKSCAHADFCSYVPLCRLCSLLLAPKAGLRHSPSPLQQARLRQGCASLSSGQRTLPHHLRPRQGQGYRRDPCMSLRHSMPLHDRPCLKRATAIHGSPPKQYRLPATGTLPARLQEARLQTRLFQSSSLAFCLMLASSSPKAFKTFTWAFVSACASL